MAATQETTKRPAAREHRAPDTLEISARRVTQALVAGSLLLVLAHLFFSLNYLHGFRFPGATQLYVLFDAAGEVTVPTWYSSSLLLGAALLCGGIAALVRRQGLPFFRHWLGLALILLGLSIDEAADAHGAISYRMSDVLNTSGPLTYPWVIPAALFTLVVGLVYLSFLRRIDPVLRRRLLLAGSVYVGAALGLEMVQAAYDSDTSSETVYALLVGVEEGLEMIAIAILIGALLSHMAPMLRRETLQIRPLESR